MSAAHVLLTRKVPIAHVPILLRSGGAEQGGLAVFPPSTPRLAQVVLEELGCGMHLAAVDEVDRAAASMEGLNELVDAALAPFDEEEDFRVAAIHTTTPT